jgi:hypothetical protein
MTNRMEDNFALRYVFTYPGIISRAELVPSHGASRRRETNLAASRVQALMNSKIIPIVHFSLIAG